MASRGRHTKAERLTNQALAILGEISRIRSLTDSQAEQIRDAVVRRAQDMVAEVSAAKAGPTRFSLQPDSEEG